MATIIEAGFVGIFFVLLLSSGAWAFGTALGTPMRGAVAPLLIIPLLMDWARWMGHLSPAEGGGFALALYAAAALTFLIVSKPAGPFASMDRESRQRWMVALGFLILVHVIIRTWIFTGRGPLPSDDSLAGYKIHGLLESPSWPTAFPEAPELPMGYYYFSFTWPALFILWANLTTSGAWWPTAITLCVAGPMLVIELILPYLRCRGWRDFPLALLMVALGCDISYLPALARLKGPKDWYVEGGALGELGHHYGLYLRPPQMVTYLAANSPFAGFVGGILLVVVALLWRLIVEKKLSRAEFILATLIMGSLAGYNTLGLIGFAMAVAPVLTVAAIIVQRGDCIRHWFAPLAGMAAGAVALSLPNLLVLMHRSGVERGTRFKDPLLVWLRTGLPSAGWGVFAMLVAAYAVFSVTSNLALAPIIFRKSKEPLPAFTKMLLWVFGVGTFVCLFGVTDDFPAKFSPVLCMGAILAYFTVDSVPKWSTPLLYFGVAALGLCALNTARANMVADKIDPIWKVLNQIYAQKHEFVDFDIPIPEEKARGAEARFHPYWSRARFFVPADEVDDQAELYIQNPAALQTLPPTETRLREAANGSPTYLLLRSGTAAPEGERLYSDATYSLDRVKTP